MDIATVIRDIRTNMNLTQKGLAEALYVSESTVQKWETRKNSPTVDMLSKVLALSGQKLAVIADNDSYIAESDTSDANVLVKPAGKITRYKTMGMPDWVEDRFGDNIPDWAEDRWGSDGYDWDDDDDWDDDSPQPLDSEVATDSSIDPKIAAQMKEFLFNEIRTGEVYKGNVIAFVSGFGSAAAFVNVDGLDVYCDVSNAALAHLRKNDVCYVAVTRKDEKTKHVAGHIVTVKPIFTGKVSYITDAAAVIGHCNHWNANSKKEANAPAALIPLEHLSEVEGLSHEECAAYIVDKNIKFELVSDRGINNKRFHQVGENKQLYRRERKSFWYGGKVNAGDEIEAEIFHVSNHYVDIWLHGAKITIPASKIIKHEYCKNLRDSLLYGDLCKIRIINITLSENPDTCDYPVDVEAELIGITRIVDPKGELIMRTYPKLKAAGYNIKALNLIDYEN